MCRILKNDSVSLYPLPSKVISPCKKAIGSAPSTLAQTAPFPMPIRACSPPSWGCGVVQEDRIVYERIKFPKTAKPELLSKAKAIMNKYRGQMCIRDMPLYPKKTG